MPNFPTTGAGFSGSLARAILPASLLFLTISCSSVVYAPTAPGAITIMTVIDLGPIPQSSKILGRDGAYSALFQGNSVWLYGDTFLTGPNAQGFTLISDSWSYTADLNAQDGFTSFQQPVDSAGMPVMILPETAAEQAYNQQHNGANCQVQPCGARWALWPASIVTDPASGHALIFYGVISAQPGNFNFQGVGSSVATWSSLSAQPVRPIVASPIDPSHPDLIWGQNDPGFGSASVISAGTLYAFGCGTPSSGTDKGCRLARADPAQAQTPAAWTYYSGSANWSPQVFSAVSLFTGDNILSVDWNSYLGLWVAVYSAPLSDDILIRTAPSLTGPWSNPGLLFTAMAPASGNVYDAHAHSEYDVNGGQTFFVTYSRSTGAFTSEVRLVAIQVKPSSQL